MWAFKLALLVIASLSVSRTDGQTVEEYLQDYNIRLGELYQENVVLSWNYYTDLTQENLDKMTESDLKLSQFSKDEAVKAAEFDQSNIADEAVLRQLGMILDVGISGYEDTDKLRKINDLRANMTSIYSTARWCPTIDDCKPLEPDLTDIITNSRNYDELTNAWKGWRDVSGKQMRAQYAEFVGLMNEAIKAEGRYADMGDYYRSWYESDTFETDVESLFDQLAPLYNELHAYVRRKLRTYYGAEHFPASGHIPAHLFGNMWAQQWGNIYSLLEPYPGEGRDSLTTEMIRQNYTITRMYETAEEFFTSLGLEPMPDTFWTHSMLEKPDDREVVCHASAWDFYNGTDFRIKQCTTLTEDQFTTVHHEMGHVQYFLEYRHQPVLYRGGANPGFHEGMADIVTLSFLTPEHLQEIGLVEELPTGTNGDINFLFLMALDKVAFLPFGYLIDQWRWSVYRGDTNEDSYNYDWWKLRCKYQGIAPPVTRTEDDFDPGAKYHIPGNTPYIRYFVSFVAQFQWHKALCEVSNNTRPLHRCDIYRNQDAGNRLKEMLRMGSSRPWGEAMMKLTAGTSAETNKLDAGPLIEYFEPLRRWLQDQNEASLEKVGWDDSCPNVVAKFGTSGGSDVAVTPALLLSLICMLLWKQAARE